MFDKTNTLLTESVEQNRVIDAIKKRYEVRVNYKSDDEPKGSGERIIQPVAYGLSKSGNPVVRAFQPFGDTKTKVPHWKLFRLDRFDSWKPLKNRKFEEPPKFPFVTDGKFNPNGDKSMSEVYIIADFEGTKARYERGGLKKYNAKRKAEKMAADPFYKMRQNLKKSVMATPEIMKRVQQWQQNKPQGAIDYLQGKNAEEMQKTKNSFNTSTTQTSGPITKITQQTQVKDKDNDEDVVNTVMSNGPVTRNKENIQQQNKYQTFSDEENLEDNNKEDKENFEEYGK